MHIGVGVRKKWINEIQERVLMPGEELLAVVKGAIETERVPLSTRVDKRKDAFTVPRAGVLVCTNHRAFFYIPRKRELEVFPLNEITTVRFTRGLLLGRIHLIVSYNEKVIKWVYNKDGEAITRIITEQTRKKQTGKA